MKNLKDLEEISAVQCEKGNWNYDSYNHGLANGLILAIAILKNKRPIFLKAPDKWLRDDSKK